MGHTCTLKFATSDHLRELIQQNLGELQAILEHNVANDWRLFRVRRAARQTCRLG
jgi:UV DNA damage repair endonuclease